MERILVVGALGQVGRELLQALNLKFGIENVISSDIRQAQDIENQQEILDILDKDGLANLVKREKILGVPGYDDAARNITAGSTYHTIYYGLNSMGSYAGQLDYEERWQVSEYVMQLKQDLTK